MSRRSENVTNVTNYILGVMNTTEETALGDSNYPSPMVRRLLDFITTILLILIIISSFGHIIVIVCIYKDKTLRTAFNCYVIALSIADCLISLIAAPIHLVQQLNHTQSIHEVWCFVKTSTATVSIVYSLLSMCVIALIRLRCVVRPFKYITMKVIAAAIAAQTLLSVTVHVMIFDNPNLMYTCRMMHMMYREDTFQHYKASYMQIVGSTASTHWWLSIPVIATLSFLLSISSYIVIFSALRSRRLARIEPLSDASISGESRTIPMSVSFSQPGQSVNQIQTTRQPEAGVSHNTIQNADILTLKAALVLTIAFFSCYTPSFLVGFCVGSGRGYLYPFVTTLTYCHCILNPIIYIWKSTMFKLAFHKVFF